MSNRERGAMPSAGSALGSGAVYVIRASPAVGFFRADAGIRDVELYEVSGADDLELKIGLEIKRIAGRIRDEIAIELRRHEAQRAQHSGPRD